MATQSKQPKKRLTTKGKILKALEEEHGVVTTACKKIGLSRSAYYRGYVERQEIKQETTGSITFDFN